MFHFDVDIMGRYREGYPMSIFPPSMQYTANWLNITQTGSNSTHI